MPRKLKVFRTAVGFRDAYVAAPSRAAALRAWGTEKDLFARGSAEEVTDPELTEAALGKPGEVVYRTRGSLKEQVAALGPMPKRKPTHPEQPARKDKPASKRAAKRVAPPKPRPSRAELDAAQEAIAAFEADHAEETAMREKERRLAQERAAMVKRRAEALQKLQQHEAKARKAYEAALRRWEP